jgi:glycosyltransferase involved in cell wall biosynthesis
MYKVTLAMPVYNVEKYIEKALLSALNQTFESIEYLLIDDKGIDSSIDIAKNSIKNHLRGKDVRIIDHGINRGTGATKNTAIDNAQGEFLYFMDSDDEITPDCISILYKAMVETPVDFVAASGNYISIDGKIADIPKFIISYSQNSFINEAEYAVAEAYYLENIMIATPTWNKLYNIEFLRKNNIRCIPWHINEDILFTYQVILYAQSCSLLSCITYNYYERTNSIMMKAREGYSSRLGKQYAEISNFKREYSKKYKGCNFYSSLIQRDYTAAINNAFRIYDSTLVSLMKKRQYNSIILRYPVSYNEILGFRDKSFHVPRYWISKMPTISLKIFLLKCLLKVEYLKIKKTSL